MASVLTIGTFDLFHWGHVAFLRECQRFAGQNPRELAIGVNTDRFAAEFKGPPVMSQDERVHAVDQAMPIAEVMLNDGPGRDLISDLRPRLLMVGSDWAQKDYLHQIGVSQAWLDSLRVIVAYVPYQLGAFPISATEIRRRIRERAQ